MSKQNVPRSSEMLPIMFENLFRQVFGDKKYYGTASAFSDNKYRKKQLSKLLKRYKEHVDELVASEKFKEYLSYQIGYLSGEISRTELDNASLGILLVNLKIIATFLGYHYASGGKRVEPYFIPTIWAEKQGWLESLDYYKERDKLILKRQDVVKQLLDEGHTLSEVAYILNISGYKVAQIKRQIDAGI